MANPSLASQIKTLNAKLKKYESRSEKATVVALNKTTKPLVMSVSKAVAEREKIPASVIRKQVKFDKATSNRHAAYIKSKTRGINVIRLLPASVIAKRMGTGTNKFGVSVRGREFKSAFINTVRRNGKALVFSRVGDERLPLEVKRIPIEDSLKKIQPDLAMKRFKDNFKKFYAQEMRYRSGANAR